MNLALPPDVAAQKKIQAMQQNQLYSLAFQIYSQMIDSHDAFETAKQKASASILAAETFNFVVSMDSKRREAEKAKEKK